MSYKYRSVRQLVHLIDSGQVKDGLNIKKVIEVYNKSLLKPPVKRPNTSWKPRFYNRAMTMNTRSKKLGTGEMITHQELELVYDKYDGKCAKCNNEEHIVFDHIISYFNKGTNTIDNLQLLCRICNTKKGAN